MIRAIDTDVLIVGAGPVGLAAALELKRQGVACRLVEARRDDPGGEFSRATELNGRTLELLDRNDLAVELVAAGLPVRRIPFFSAGDEIAVLDLDRADSPLPASLVVPQSGTEFVLRERLTRAGVMVEQGRRLASFTQDDDGVTAEVVGPEETIRARYLLAADGSHSHVRDALGIAFAGDDYPGWWAAVDARVEGWPFETDVLPVYLDHYGFWAMALPSGDHRLFFSHDADDGAPPSVAATQDVLDRHLATSAHVAAVTDARCFRLHHRVADRYRGGRVFLAGDAAHTASPVAGRNMNTGIQDAVNLGWKLALACAGDAADGLLDSYEAERRPVGLAMVEAVDATHAGNLLEAPPAVDRRDRAIATGLATPAQRAAVAEAGHQLHLSYRDSPIVGPAGHPDWTGPQPGDRVVPAPSQLRDWLRSTRHLLIACGGATPIAMPDLGRHAEHVDVHVLDRQTDPGLAMHARLGAAADALYLIRPDGYLAARTEPPDPNAIRATLERTLA